MEGLGAERSCLSLTMLRSEIPMGTQEDPKGCDPMLLTQNSCFNPCLALELREALKSFWARCFIRGCQAWFSMLSEPLKS